MSNKETSINLLPTSEFKILTSQNAISSYGGRIYLPYVYTEQGIVALALIQSEQEANY